MTLSTIIGWDICFQSDKKFHEFLIESVKIEEMASKPDPIHDIYTQCPIRKETYFLEDDDGKLRVHLYKVQHELFGKENWLPFLAHFVEGEFRVEGALSYDKWGARFNGKGGYKDLQVIEEWR